jgi:galactose-1-phosphate uridylyltransferase
MLEDLDRYLKNTKKTDLKKLEKIVESFVKEPSGQIKKHEIKIRKNPVFNSKSRIAPERELRPMETNSAELQKASTECYFCNPQTKVARFTKETRLKEQYYMNDSVAFPNLFPFGNIHGVVVYDYKRHVTDPRSLSASNWIDGLKLVREIGKDSGKKYVSSNINCGPKAAASLEHFHGQFHCEDEPLSMTLLAMKLGNKKYWKSWVKALLERGLVINFDNESKTVLFIEWSPAFGKTELVVMNLENPCFQNMSDKEIESVAKFLSTAIRLTMSKVSDQFNVVNLSASSKDDFCNQFRIFPRSPLSQGIKSWEGYAEAMNETIPHISPEKLSEILEA